MFKILKNKEAFAVLQYKEFVNFLVARFFVTIAVQMQTVVISWQVYEYSRDPLALGMIGISEVIPFFITSIFSGHISDNYNRKKIIIYATIGLIGITLGQLYFSVNSQVFQSSGLLPLYILTGCSGIVRGFFAAAFMPLMIQLVPRKIFAVATTWNSTVWHTAVIVGPSLAGLLCVLSFTVAYSVSLAFVIVTIISMLFISSYPVPKKEKKEPLRDSLLGGIKFVLSNRVILNVMLLDFLVVLFGGAIAMLPVFADKIYGVGTSELGIMTSMPALGAIVTAVIMAFKPPVNAGKNMLLSVFCFSLVTICFALNTNYFFGLFLLFLIGVFDNVIVVVRHTIVQLSTPDDMQGRVAAVGSIINGSSVEISSFESGLTTRLFGLVPAIFLGGGVTLLVTIIAYFSMPNLKKINIHAINVNNAEA